MNNRIENHKSDYLFRFKGVEIDNEVEKDANLGLAKLLVLAPPQARAVGILERVGNVYISAVEVYSPFRSFEEKSSALTPQKAVQKVLEKIEDRLYRWRFGGSNNGNENQVYQNPQLQG